MIIIRRIFTGGIIVCLLLFGILTPAWAARTVDHTLYSGLLNTFVRNGVVDYQGLKTEEATLDTYLTVLEKTDVKLLLRNEQFAFYINAYNAWTLKLILINYPGVASIKDLGSFFQSPWKKKICRIDGSLKSLDDIEHGILRPRFKDPRVHFAINCAAKGCPPLRAEAYQGNILDQQLNEMTVSFINNKKSNYFKNSTLYVSLIFKWFKEDFDNDIIGFFLKYGSSDLQKQLRMASDPVKIRYLDYDWSLNDG